MTRVFRTAVELDEWLSRLTPEDRREIRSRANVGLMDQVKKAQADGIAERERRLGHKARWVAHDGVPEWVRLGVLDTLLAWDQGRALTCIHQPRLNKPQPVYAAAWKPGVVVCAGCTHLLVLTGVADTICDGCGHKCRGLPDDGICPVNVFTGALIYQIGVCTSCHEDMKRIEREANTT